MLLELKEIKKSFGQVRVLKGVSFTLEAGKVLGLVGENGAGKSTLMNILGGIHKPSSGEVFLEGKAFAPQGPTVSLNSGIALIHQELNLFPNLTVFENLFVKNFPRKSVAGIKLIDRRAAIFRAKELLEQVGLDIEPDRIVESLSPAQRQLLEIAKALSSSPRIIIFDEPTTALTRHESRRLFSLINDLRSNGIGMIYISHNLEDVISLSDDIAVLRDGEFINGYTKGGGYSLGSIIRDMVGRDMDQFFPDRDNIPRTDHLLEVKNLGMAPIVNGVSFVAKKGEVLGFYGLVGAGRSEVARCIYGLDSFEYGEVLWNGMRVKTLNPAAWISRGVAFLTEDRREEGLLLDQSIEKNVALASLGSFASAFLRRIKRKDINSAAKKKAEATRVKCDSFDGQATSTLSGGNQQKIVLAKWLLTDPKLLILDEPTKGIDVGAKHDIYELVNELVGNGSSVLLISSELEELLGMCDRILVMNRGRISAEFAKDVFNREAILESALHVMEEAIGA
ncbi:sugar ABC transporter ATP-binding protein [Puniceicoccaceae bacterium K14]|nr:sugar ABC transporter ATP-binding protein [Puniceicoccaceae bacterium K14]